MPSLPSYISEGEDIDEALVNIQEAIELYFDPLEHKVSSGEGIIVRELVLSVKFLAFPTRKLLLL